MSTDRATLRDRPRPSSSNPQLNRRGRGRGTRTRTILELALILLTALASGLFATPASAGSPVGKVEIAAAISLTGEAKTFGVGSLEGITLAIEEANASGLGPRIELKTYDDKSTDEDGQRIAAQVVASPAILVIGPTASSTSLAAGPIFAQAGLPSITTTATSDLITDNPTTFRILFKNSEQGEMLATYLVHVLGQKRAAVLVSDDGYGRTLEKGFRAAAERFGINAHYFGFKKGEGGEEVARKAAAVIGDLPVVLAMLDLDGAQVLPVLRRLNVKGPFLGGDAFGVESFNSHFADLPEEKAQPGYFSEELYGISPMLLDSANAEMLSFAERFKTRFGHEPGWVTVAGYDAALMAIKAIRGAAAEAQSADPLTMRAAALKFLLALNDPANARTGLLGPLVFDSSHGRPTAVRIGRFNRGRFESAPLQIVPVLNPDESALKSGEVFEIRPGACARLQQVIYTGMYLNEISRIDPARFTFAADFYLWLRFTKKPGPASGDPTDINFPDFASGTFDRERPAEQGQMPDGTSYRLWRVQGEFRNDFNLHRFPFDRQTLTLRFFNAKADADRMVYVLDQRAPHQPSEFKSSDSSAVTSAAAFRNLSQWRFLGAKQRRENLVTKSSLGDPRRVGLESQRELSGYSASIEFRRQAVRTLSKSLLPLLLMTCILYASLHFPPILVQPKIAVAMTAVLTGVVLLTSINTQLGSVGYTVAVEYAFYIFFALGLLHIISVLVGEHLRAVGHSAVAQRADVLTRCIFIAAVLGLCIAAFFYSKQA